MAMTFAGALGAIAGTAGAAILLFALTSGSLRRAMLFSLFERSRGWISPRYVVVGDSLSAQCPWSRGLSVSPFGVLNLAVGGATLGEIGGQVMRSRSIRKRFLLINGGLNDLLAHGASREQIEHDFKTLLRRVDAGPVVVVTLMPYVADPAMTARIDEANGSLRRLAEERGCLVVDLNPEVSSDGVRRTEMTQDGLHFTPLADSLWIDAVRRTISAGG